MRNWGKAGIVLIVAVLISTMYAPQLLAFPCSAKVGHHAVYSERPIGAAVTAAISKADLLVGRSILPTDPNQSIFLTQGGWRWRWLTRSGADGPFALTRAGVETIVVNRSDGAADKVYRRAAPGGERSLSGTLAHEMTHGAIRRHFGLAADLRYPQWLREGFCDYVAGGSTLSDAEATTLSRADPYHPALTYWRGRKRVEAALIRNGGSVDRLFATFGN
jgi:hypothetical protein